MKIIYNSTEANCPNFDFEGSKVEGIGPGQIKQYDDAIAEDMIDRWGFLKSITPEKAQELLAKPKEGDLKCEFCDFKTDYKMALASHMRTHKEEVAKKSQPAIDPNIIPVAATKKIVREKINTLNSVDDDDETRNGRDRDGVEWYGEGVQEENRSQTHVPKMGEGHFSS